MSIIDGKPTTRVEASAIAATAAQGATLASAFGVTQGATISPAHVQPIVGPNVWQLANLVAGNGRNTATLTPSLTANGTSQNSVTWVNMNNRGSGQDSSFRLEFDYVNTMNGTAYITIAASDGASGLASGTNRQYIQSGQSSGHIVFDFNPQAVFWTFELRLDTLNNSSTGTLSVSNLSLTLTGGITRPMWVSDTSFPQVQIPFTDAVSGTNKCAVIDFSSDTVLATALQGITVYNTEVPYSGGATAYPDPTMARASTGAPYASNVVVGGRSMRVGNNDQILNVWNGGGYELRGNAHGGETIRGSVSLLADTGSGFAPYTPASRNIPVRRFQLLIPTQMQTTTGGSPFANVDHTVTIFHDGVMRVDRSTTFLASTQMDTVFEWMSSHDTNTPYFGRIGRGLSITGYVDVNNYLTVPTISTVTTATSGGTLAAATYSYRVTALNASGETTPATAVTVTSTGTTSANTVNWSSITNATGYRVYGRVAGSERLLATVGPSVTSWVDDGSAVPTAPAPLASGAIDYTVTPNKVAGATSTDASWACWYEPRWNFAYGNIFDRDSVLARTGVAYARVRLTAGSGTCKNYTNLFWTGQAASLTVSPGTVWSATHWSYIYSPQDTANWHNEIAIRAANIGALKSVYPNT